MTCTFASRRASTAKQETAESWECGNAGMRMRNESIEEDQWPGSENARGTKERKGGRKKERGSIPERRTSLVPVPTLVLAVGAARDDVWEHGEGHECERHPGEVCGCQRDPKCHAQVTGDARTSRRHLVNVLSSRLTFSHSITLPLSRCDATCP
jgi:hypothetical protein